MKTPGPRDLPWITSSYSADDDKCVEIAALPAAGLVFVRDSKNPDGGTLRFPQESLDVFVQAFARRGPARRLVQVKVVKPCRIRYSALRKRIVQRAPANLPLPAARRRPVPAGLRRAARLTANRPVGVVPLAVRFDLVNRPG
ncbi:DUF397 domain-containing protein [Pseudonocardiaceae bacterium YIM PH 21723]|nr:DUF397 domain-containing protein [Pseudonocardiaceae bacterium YIM PH 21723]